MKLKSHFEFNKQQRNGIFFLLLLIAIFQSVYFFIDFSNNDPGISEEKLIALQKQIDSLKNIETKLRTTPKIFPFNPNYLSDHKAYSFGMSNQEIDKLLEYRSQGRFVNSAEEFQNLTGISDSLLSVMSPYFVFPDWVYKKDSVKATTTNIDYISIETKDLNAVTVDDLKKISGIGDKLSERIIKYRTLLGGFIQNDQLFEVYGLNKETAEKVLEVYPVKTIPELDKINLNEATLKQLASIVYISYNEAKEIIIYRSKKGKIESFSELGKIEGFTVQKINRIKLYLTLQ